MKRLLVFVCLALWAHAASAQNLVVTNARILDGKGGVIARGYIVVRGGKIATVSQGAAPAVAGARVVNANGMTVMPGFIDAHRHLFQGDPDQFLKAQAPSLMREFLEAGFTTVLSPIDPRPQQLELRRRVNAGEIRGPRMFAAALIPLAGQAGGRGGGGGQQQGDPARFDVSRPPLRPTTAAPAIPREQTIKDVETVASLGFDYIKTVIIATPGGPETETLRLIVQEGKKHNLPTITHAVSVIDTLAAVDAGTAVLVHTPHIGHLEDDPTAVQKIVQARIPMTSTLAIFIPHFSAENTPLFRDGLPFPWNTISSGGQGPVNARLLWEAGIVSYGYGTDTRWPPRESLADELRALSLVFSPKDIVTILTKNAASSMLKSDQIGTIEPGKLADLVLLPGDPLADVNNLLNVAVTIKGGVVVSDRRAAAATR